MSPPFKIYYCYVVNDFLGASIHPHTPSRSFNFTTLIAYLFMILRRHPLQYVDFEGCRLALSLPLFLGHDWEDLSLSILVKCFRVSPCYSNCHLLEDASTVRICPKSSQRIAKFSLPLNLK